MIALQRGTLPTTEEAEYSHQGQTVTEDAMIKFYYSGAPNPMKVALFLEEAGLPYEPIPVGTPKGEEHHPEYLTINPKAQGPPSVDRAGMVFGNKASLL